MLIKRTSFILLLLQYFSSVWPPRKSLLHWNLLQRDLEFAQRGLALQPTWPRSEILLGHVGNKYVNSEIKGTMEASWRPKLSFQSLRSTQNPWYLNRTAVFKKWKPTEQPRCKDLQRTLHPIRAHKRKVTLMWGGVASAFSIVLIILCPCSLSLISPA